MDSLPNKKNLVPISEAAKVLGVSIDTVRRWDKSGQLHSERPDGKNRYFSLDELENHKLNQPLSISEVAEKFNISATTLRRLETRGLIKPSRNSAGERVYDQDLLKNFLNSDYFLRKKQIKELTDSTAPENEHEQEQENENEPTIPPINLKPRPRSRINEFITVSTITFALLFTGGIRNIWINEYKQTSTPQVLSVTKEVSKAPADAVKTQISEATSEAKPKTTAIVKLEDGSLYVNIRQKPTAASKKISEAKNGEIFELISRNKDWFEVKIASGSGFISVRYMEENK